MNILSKTVAGLAVVTMISGGPATAQEAPGAIPKMLSKQSAANDDFTDKADKSNILEIGLGKLAMTKASSSSDMVKRFAQRLVDDHARLSDELDGIAGKDNLVVTGRLDSDDQATVDRLSHLTGNAFDRAWMDQVVMEHVKAVALFQSEASSGTNSDLKAWAASTLPTLQDHLREAREIENRIVGGTL